MSTSIGTGRLHEGGLDCRNLCEICGTSRTTRRHQACAQIRKAIYSAPAAQRLEVQALQRQGYRPQAITGAGIGLSRGNDHRVVCADGSTQRGVGARK
jgi:hypothetical protein